MLSCPLSRYQNSSRFHCPSVKPSREASLHRSLRFIKKQRTSCASKDSLHFSHSLTTFISPPCSPSTPSLPLDQTLRYLSKALESSLTPAEAAVGSVTTHDRQDERLTTSSVSLPLDFQHLLQAIPALKSILPGLLLPADIPLLARQNLDVAHLFLATFFAAPSPQSDAVQLESYAVALADLELGLAGLDLFTRLLVVRDPTKGLEVLAKIVKVEALGPYIARYVDYIDVLASLGGEDDTCARLVRIVRCPCLCFQTTCRRNTDPPLSLAPLSILADRPLRNHPPRRVRPPAARRRDPPARRIRSPSLALCRRPALIRAHRL